MEWMAAQSLAMDELPSLDKYMNSSENPQVNSVRHEVRLLLHNRLRDLLNLTIRSQVMNAIGIVEGVQSQVCLAFNISVLLGS